MKPDDPPADAATPEDVHQAIEALSKEDRYRLRKAAWICLPGTEYQQPAELIHEAIIRTMSASNGGNGRRWPKNVPFMAYMIQTIKGLADDSKESLPQKQTDHMEAMAIEGETSEDALGSSGHFNPDTPTQAIELEDVHRRQARAEADADLIDGRFVDDDEVMFIIMGHKDGMSAAAIREVSGMSQTQYETARKRLRRGLEKLFPGRRAS